MPVRSMPWSPRESSALPVASSKARTTAIIEKFARVSFFIIGGSSIVYFKRGDPHTSGSLSKALTSQRTPDTVVTGKEQCKSGGKKSHAGVQTRGAGDRFSELRRCRSDHSIVDPTIRDRPGIIRKPIVPPARPENLKNFDVLSLILCLNRCHKDT